MDHAVHATRAKQSSVNMANVLRRVCSPQRRILEDEHRFTKAPPQPHARSSFSSLLSSPPFPPQVIQGFTDKKRERNVDETLTRLYQPILWRALKVANPVVRANAAALLSDAFPLQSDELTRAEADQCVPPGHMLHICPSSDGFTSHADFFFSLATTHPMSHLKG